MMMAENYFTEVNKRVFDIYVEDRLASDNLDLYKAVGKNAAYDLIVENITVSDDVLDIYFPAESNNPLLDGIVIEQISTGVNEQGNKLPDIFRLEQNFPNPFNGSTIIKFHISKEQPIDFNIYDTLGKRVFSKRIENPMTGENFISWNSTDDNNLPVGSGIYFYTLRSNDLSVTKKLLLLK